MTRVILCGVSGAMGKTVLETLPQDMTIVAGVAKDVIDCDFKIYEEISLVQEAADIIIDFSHVSLVPSIIEYALEKKLPLLIASTGLTDSIHSQIDNASQTIPIMQSGNYSFGVYAMMKAVHLLTRIMDDADIEIVEKHHRFKKDAPSGTAQMLFNTIKNIDNDFYPVYDRSNAHEIKDIKEVGIHSIRSGTIVGEHTVSFALDDELVEITHKARSKKIFANGAYKAARFLLTKETGRYSLEDVVEDA